MFKISYLYRPSTQFLPPIFPLTSTAAVSTRIGYTYRFKIVAVLCFTLFLSFNSPLKEGRCYEEESLSCIGFGPCCSLGGCAYDPCGLGSAGLSLVVSGPVSVAHGTNLELTVTGTCTLSPDPNTGAASSIDWASMQVIVMNPWTGAVVSGPNER